ncbi:alanine--tRNA ligase [Candidatus Dependentiae bacterium]|nr:alanine--tRNA ligase [Candidatus Dependentiae bacterium]
MNSSEIRKKFFDFFIARQHEQVASSSLIPAQDPTLLFANAGMNQFKDVFLGLEQRSYTRAVSIQKCVRAGGKHNDLDNVGFTKRHLTFFEMMGNFSFGDYFKKEAITFAWDFLTREMQLPVELLHASVYLEDQESYNIWHQEIGLPKERIHKLGAADNFWQMGDTGPCGPCTEIYIDRGAEHGCKEKSCSPGCSCDRFLEIWNNVFMQFDRQTDDTDKPLKRTGVDTGMGLERLCAVMQQVESVYETDLFMPIIKQLEKVTGKAYAQQPAAIKGAFRVLADHIRSSSLLIADGCTPSNDGRGYVLRKIIRRAALFAQKLTDGNIFPVLSRVVVKEMGDVYPALRTNATLIEQTLASEIDKFASNLVRGRTLLEDYFTTHAQTKIIDGLQAFKMYDTYGFPLELVTLVAEEKGFSVDRDGFEQQMLKQKNLSGKKVADALSTLELPEEINSEFTGYQELETSSTLVGLVHDGNVVDQVAAGETCYVIAQKSPFFIVGGGQVPDNGWVVIAGKQIPVLEARYIQKVIALQIAAPVDLKLGMPIVEIVNKELREKAMKNHTATHMLQAALMQLFGQQIKQSGSLVHPDYLRFDFTCPDTLTADDIVRVEQLVNEKIMEDIPVKTEYTTMKEATSRGALAFFGDKYNPDKVRLVDIPAFSAELCGGTHVPSTGTIGVFKITEVTALSAGLRRIVAVTGLGALKLFQESFATVKTLSQDFKVKRDEVLESVDKQTKKLHAAEQQIKQLQKEATKAQIPLWASQAELIGNTPVLLLQLQGLTMEQLRETANTLQAHKAGFYCLASAVEGKNSFICSVAPALTAQIDLKAFGAWLQQEHAIRSGGSATHIQGGMPQADITTLAATIKQWINKR